LGLSVNAFYKCERGGKVCANDGLKLVLHKPATAYSSIVIVKNKTTYPTVFMPHG
jgi:hypothetical protein